MNKKVPEITECEKELKTRLCTAKKKHEVQRLNALYLLKSGAAKNRTQVADLLGVHRLSVGAWLSVYETGGLEEMLKRGSAPGATPILTEAQKERLREELETPQGFSSYGQIVEFIDKTFNIKMNYKTVYAMVHDKWGAKLKVPRPSHEKKTS